MSAMRLHGREILWIRGQVSNGMFSRGLLSGLSPFGSVPEVEGVLYVVGDVHGRLDLLEDLMGRLLRDAVRLAPELDAKPQLAFVGDVIDRGPDSRGVVEFLSALSEWPEFETIFVTGNHERMLLSFLQEPSKGRRWLRYGGYETLLSYGLKRLGDIDDPADMQVLADQLRAVMGPHVDFLDAMVPCHRAGNVLVTHAGADPDMPADAQSPRTLAWGCDSFLKKRRSDGVWVVYGHTIVDTPTMRRGRIAIDTGAYTSGRLTALRIHGGTVSFVTATGEQREGDDD